jgi:putative transcriptional regulator
MTAIKEIRGITGLTQQAFADQFGIPMRTIQNWETGARGVSTYLADMMELLAYEQKLNKHLAWYVISERNGDIFGMDKPYLSLSTAMMDAYKDWNVYTTDEGKEHQSIHVALMEVDNGNDNWSGDEYKAFSIDDIKSFGI